MSESNPIISQLKIKPVPRSQVSTRIHFEIADKRSKGKSGFDLEKYNARLVDMSNAQYDVSAVSAAVPRHDLTTAKKQGILEDRGLLKYKSTANITNDTDDSDSDTDVVLRPKKGPQPPTLHKAKFVKKIVIESDDEDEESDESEPTIALKPRKKGAPAAADSKKKRGRIVIDSDDDESSDDARATIRTKQSAKSKSASKTAPNIAATVSTSFTYDDMQLEIDKRLPDNRSAQVDLEIPAYYMSNREMFVTFIDSLFSKYKDDLMTDTSDAITCENMLHSRSTELMNHQMLVRDYMSAPTPNRGVLVFHGLGSGKTRTSISVAMSEGLQNKRKVIIMTPASLHQNYIEEIKKYGDEMYRKYQHWEWIPIVATVDVSKMATLTNALGLSNKFVEKHGGVWLMDATKASNYSYLSDAEQRVLNAQLVEMIEHKYEFIHYNGVTTDKFKKMTKNYTINVFDNSVVIVDEAHNLVSRIVNKLNRMKKGAIHATQPDVAQSLSIRIYKQLLSAHNCRIVFLTGTPIINYVNEIGILFNILRGYIYTWEITIKPKNNTRVDIGYIKSALREENEKIVDYIGYQPSSKTVTITRNPYYFENVRDNKMSYKGVIAGSTNLTNDEFIDHIKVTFEKHGMTVTKTKLIYNTALPDNKDDFAAQFVNDNKIKDIEKFKRRVLGLTSYFRSAQEELLPRYDKLMHFNVVRVPMSDYQFQIHEHARISERELERNSAKKSKSKNASGVDDRVGSSEVLDQPSSTYRIFSRLACNFVMPDPPGRPLPGDDLLDAGDDVVAGAKGDMVEPDDLIKEDEHLKLDKSEKSKRYKERVVGVLDYLKMHPELLTTDLPTYSPKFRAMYDNIVNQDHEGLHLVYSQFRTLEGIGIFALVLEAHGYVKLSVKKRGNRWIFDPPITDAKNIPRYAMYTGTEEPDEREIIRNIYNGSWNDIPSNLKDELSRVHTNNNMGEIVKVLMITASGSEGINLKNTRYVHVTESYWNPIRIEQVIGRARRICSHMDLPEEYRTVDVFIYLAEFTKKQLDSNDAVEMKIHDGSRLEKHKYVTSDEALYETSIMKERLINTFLRGIKESSIDCAIHTKSTTSEGLTCMSFGNTSADAFTYNPNYTKDETDSAHELNKELVQWIGTRFEYGGKTYVYRKETKQLYDYNSFQQSLRDPNIRPILLGTLEEKNGEFVLVRS